MSAVKDLIASLARHCGRQGTPRRAITCHRFRPDLSEALLERRELLSGAGLALPPGLTSSLIGSAAVTQNRSSSPTQVSAPVISTVGGATYDSAGLTNGLVDMSEGTTWNRYRAVNDHLESDGTSLFYWVINGRNFGSARGDVLLAGRQVPIGSWSDTRIVIYPSGQQLNPSRPWDWSPQCTTLTVRTNHGTVAQGVNVVPAISTRIFQQCAWWVARRRIEMGLAPSPGAYANYTAFTPSWVPQRGDQLKWGGTAASGGYHTAIIESVSVQVSGNVTTYRLHISQYNVNRDNQYTEFDTTFQVTRQANGIKVVTQAPTFRKNGPGATGYYR